MPGKGATPFTFVAGDPTRVLVVDDDPILREFATVYLAAPNTSVATAADAAQGLARLAEEDFDIVLADIDMPGMNGVEMVRVIRADNDTPIVMLTGLDDTASIDASFEAGATSFVTKPVNWRLLSYHIRFVLRAHRDAQRSGAMPREVQAQSEDRFVTS